MLNGTRFARRVGLRTAIAGIAAVALFAGWRLHAVPVAIVVVYAMLGSVAFALYAIDKLAAMHGRQRTPESMLHAVALFGGWPGALLAQDLFRHKSRKVRFQVVFWITVFINGCALGWVLHHA